MALYIHCKKIIGAIKCKKDDDDGCFLIHTFKFDDVRIGLKKLEACMKSWSSTYQGQNSHIGNYPHAKF